MNRRNFKQFLGKISKFPDWMKTILYQELSTQLTNDTIYTYTTYKPVLTYKGNCELKSEQKNFDRNIYNILELIEKDYNICEISMDTYLTLEEISSYFLLCVNSGYIEKPEHPYIMNMANFIAGKTRTGEYLSENKIISSEQLSKAIDVDKQTKSNRKFGQILSDLGFTDKQYINNLFKFKEESKKRFIADYGEIPETNRQYANTEDKYKKEIEDLQTENKQLKTKLNQLLLLVKTND